MVTNTDRELDGVAGGERGVLQPGLVVGVAQARPHHQRLAAARRSDQQKRTKVQLAQLVQVVEPGKEEQQASLNRNWQP